MTKIVKYKDWTFEVDYERTKEVYDSLEHGSPEGCACSDCKNFVANREEIYPREIKAFLSELGIDYKKESEAYHMSRLENGLHHYGGWFHVKGRIIEGKDCRVKLPNGARTLESELVEDSFYIAFMKGTALNYFEEKEKDELIQIDFLVCSEWIIDKALESD